MNKQVREWKSNTFSMLMQEKKYALEVYNALNSSDYKDESLVEIIEVDGGISISVRHDAAFIINTSLNLYEHQSTINLNMPLRFLVYVAECMKTLTRKRRIYGTALIKLPEPTFIVFYNGIKEMEEDSMELKLSDAYENKSENLALELRCTVYNINEGHNKALKGKSKALDGYMKYTSKVRAYTKDDSKGIAAAIEQAIDECIAEGILPDFFKRNKHMIIENDTIDCTYERQIEDMNEDMEKMALELKAKDDAIAIKDSALAEKDNALAEKDNALAEKDNALAEKDNALAEKNNALAEKDEIIRMLRFKLDRLGG